MQALQVQQKRVYSRLRFDLVPGVAQAAVMQPEKTAEADLRTLRILNYLLYP